MARIRRHPLEVTIDRLGDHYERYHSHLSGAERDQISQVRFVLERIVDEIA